MIANKFLKITSVPADRHRRSKSSFSPTRFRGKSILNPKYWLPHLFLLLTMGFAVTIVVAGVLNCSFLIEPFLENFFDFWVRMAILITCVMALVSINESIS